MLNGFAVFNCLPKTTEPTVNVAEHPAAPLTVIPVGEAEYPEPPALTRGGL